MGRARRWLLVSIPMALLAGSLSWLIAASLGADMGTAATVATCIAGVVLLPLGAWAERGQGRQKTSMPALPDIADSPSHIFLCYSHQDGSSYSETLARYLSKNGLPVWFDKEIISGQRWHEVTQSKIDSCVAFLVVVTPGATESKWVAREIARAEDAGKQIFPLLLSGKRAFQLANLHHEDVRSNKMPSPELVARLRELTISTVKQTLAHAERSVASDKEERSYGLPPRSFFSKSYGRATKVVAATVVIVLAAVGLVVTAPSANKLQHWYGSLNIPSTSPDADKFAPVRLSALEGYTDTWLTSAVFRQDGEMLAAADTGGTAILWDFHDPANPIKIANLNTIKGGDLAIRPDGKVIAVSGLTDNRFEIWSLETPAEPKKVYSGTLPAEVLGSLEFSPDGKKLAVASYPTRLYILDINDITKPKIVSTLHVNQGQVYGLAFHPRGNLLVAGDTDGRVVVWDVSNLANVKTLTNIVGHAETVSSVAFLPSRNAMATSSTDGSVTLWDISNPATPSAVATRTSKYAKYSVSFDRNGKYLAAAGYDQAVVWDLTEPSNPTEVNNTGMAGDHCVSFSPSRDVVVICSVDLKVAVWRY